MDDTQGFKRLKTADVLKGILILGVVFVHLFMLNAVSDSGRSVSLFLQPLYLGLIGFFIISGYFLPSCKEYICKIKKRTNLLLTLVVCSISLPIATYLWLSILGQPPTLDDLWSSIVSSFSLQNLLMPLDTASSTMICYSAFTHYFLWVMFWSFFIFYAIVDRVLSDLKLFAGTLVFLLAIEAILVFINLKLPFYASLIPISVAFMLFGAFLSQKHFLEKLETAEWKMSQTWIPLLVSLFTLAIFIYIFPPGVKFNFAYFGEYGGLSAFPFFIEGLLVFIMFSFVSMIIVRIPYISDLFAICGKYSLPLAVFHIFLIKFILALFYTLPTDSELPPLSMIQILILGVFSVALIVSICMYLDKKKLNEKQNPD